jgi:hypothetical protein
MPSGILYVVFNEWIRNPETNEKPYKIGITKSSVDDRYYGLGLKMPGEFKILFAYKIKNYEKAEIAIHSILEKHRIHGEWFQLSQKELDLIKMNCEAMEGTPVDDEIEKEIATETEPEAGLPGDGEAEEIKKIKRKIDRWFFNKNQMNSKILYAFIRLYEQNGGVVTYAQLEKEANVHSFKTNFDQMKNFGEKNHGKIFEQSGQDIYLWEKVKDLIWNKYREYTK